VEFYTKQHVDIGRQWDVVASPWRRAAPAGSSLLGGSANGTDTPDEAAAGSSGPGSATGVRRL
jgi:hypothetical protein